MNLISRLRPWRQDRSADAEPVVDGDVAAWLLSLSTHLGVLVILTLLVVAGPEREESMALVTTPVLPDDQLAVTEEFSYAETEGDAIGAGGDSPGDELLNAAPVLDVLPSVAAAPEVDQDQPRIDERIQLQEEIRVATGPRFSDTTMIKGVAGEGVAGATGAIDRITQEIVLSLEQRRTLVVWFFDQSGSLERQRAEINERFTRVYEELGVMEAAGNEAFKKHDNKPLLSAVVSFGEKISFPLPKPTDDVKAIQAAVSGIKTDGSGIERTFQAVHDAAERFRSFRTQEPRRNVMFVIFTDEVGDDETELDRAVGICRRYEIPVYCIGVPAPFGRRETLVKYVDPDPKFDQTPQWLPVRQGPESFQPELVKIGSAEGEEPMDSGFGPYSLTRLCYETGGIFFSVHPNRDDARRGRRNTAVSAANLSRFFDPEVMTNYRPDYVSLKEYQKLLNENKARTALVQAAQMSWLTPMERPTLVFPKVNDADLANRLSQAQRAAAVLEPKIAQIYEILKQGEKDRARLTRPRWQAGYDLSMGSLLALKVRTESYNAILATAKNGLRFSDPQHDTWRLVPDDDVSVSSTLAKQAREAKTYLQRVVQEHPQTPWSQLAENELKQPLGWRWKEEYTGVNAPRQVANANNPRPPRDDRVKMLPKPVKRPAPKL